MRQLNTPAAAIRPAPIPARVLWRERLVRARVRALPRPLARWTGETTELPDLAQRVRESGEW